MRERGYGTEELSLVSRAREGDRECLGQLIQTHLTPAFRIAMVLLRNEADAEDAVQEGVLSTIKAIRSIRREEAFRSWFFRIVANKARDTLRRQRREGAHTSYMNDDPIQQSFNHTSEEKMDVDHAVMSLPEVHREVVLLRFRAGFSTAEIAQVLDRPVGTVRRILSEAYSKLRKQLDVG